MDWIQTAMERHSGPLLRYANGLTGNAETARDVVQETFLRLCRAERGRVEGHLAAWLYTVCRNLALDVHRKERHMAPWNETVKAEIEHRVNESNQLYVNCQGAPATEK